MQFEIPLKLHDSCNFTDENELRLTNQELSCSSSCKRIECTDGYRDDDGSKCGRFYHLFFFKHKRKIIWSFLVKNNFDDRCAYNPNFCSRLSSHSECDLDENKCTCLPDYYRTQDEIICGMLFENNFIKRKKKNFFSSSSCRSFLCRWYWLWWFWSMF